MKYASKEDIMRNIFITDIAKEFGISLEATCSGNFNYRCRCPSSNHKNGNERTGSLFIDSENNNFFCFGCNAGANVIDFYMLCKEIDFSSAMLDLRTRVDPKKIKGAGYNKTRNNLPILLNISHLFRQNILAHPNDLKWINQIMRRTDEYLEDIKSNDIKKAKKLYSEIKKIFEERYNS